MGGAPTGHGTASSSHQRIATTLTLPLCVSVFILRKVLLKFKLFLWYKKPSRREIYSGKTPLGIRRMSGNEKDPIKFTSE